MSSCRLSRARRSAAFGVAHVARLEVHDRGLARSRARGRSGPGSGCARARKAKSSSTAIGCQGSLASSAWKRRSIASPSRRRSSSCSRDRKPSETHAERKAATSASARTRGPPGGLEVAAHRLVHGVAVDHRVVREQRHAQHVQVAVLERAGLVVVDLPVGQAQQLVLGDRRLDRGLRLRGRCLAREGFERRRAARDRPGRRQVERLDHEARQLARARRAVVGRRGQHQLVHRPRHRHVEEPALLEHVAAHAARQLLLDEPLGQREQRPRAAAAGTWTRRSPPGTRPGTRGPWPCAPSARGRRPRRAPPRPPPGRRRPRAAARDARRTPARGRARPRRRSPSPRRRSARCS